MTMKVRMTCLHRFDFLFLQKQRRINWLIQVILLKVRANRLKLCLESNKDI